MKMYLKETVYFEISIPDGSDRAEVTTQFREKISPMFRNILKQIVIDPEDIEILQNRFGFPADIKLMTEREALSKLNQPNPTK